MLSRFCNVKWKRGFRCSFCCSTRWASQLSSSRLGRSLFPKEKTPEFTKKRAKLIWTFSFSPFFGLPGRLLILRSLEASRAQRYKWGAYCGTNWRCTGSTFQTSCMGRRDPSPNLIGSAQKSLVQKQQKESITWCGGPLFSQVPHVT